jgi:hypothetical protein
MGLKWSNAVIGAGNDHASDHNRSMIKTSSLPDPLPEAGTQLSDYVNPYAVHGNGWENYREPVVNAIPDSMMHESMDREKRLRFRMRMGGTDFPWTIDAHKQQTVQTLKDSLLRYHCGDNEKVFTMFTIRLHLPNVADGSREEEDNLFNTMTLEKLGIQSGDFVMFSLRMRCSSLNGNNVGSS